MSSNVTEGVNLFISTKSPTGFGTAQDFRIPLQLKNLFVLYFYWLYKTNTSGPQYERYLFFGSLAQDSENV